MRLEQRFSESEYALMFQQGKEEALAFFFREFHPALSLFANRYVDNRSIAEEIASDAFVKTWKMHWKLDSYGSIRAYLYKVVIRDSIAAIRRERKRTAVHIDAGERDIVEETPYDNVLRSEVYRMVHSALRHLSPGSRRVLIMHFIEGKTTGQIAAELNLHPSTIKTQKTKGIEALRKTMTRIMPILFCFFSKIFLTFS